MNDISSWGRLTSIVATRDTPQPRRKSDVDNSSEFLLPM